MDSDEIKGIIVSALICIIVIAGTICGAKAIEAKKCHAIGEQSVETKWGGFWTGCLVKPADTWIPIDNWREIK